jgi:hypothetical protein
MTTVTTSSERNNSLVHGATREATGAGLMFELLLSLLIVIVIVVLLLSQEEPEVGLAP